MRYVALLRGINVGGNNKIKMADLKTCLDKRGMEEVKTYIQSGNIIFSSASTDKTKLAKQVSDAISEEFGLKVPTVVLSLDDMQTIIDELPKGWASDNGWKYNCLFLLPPYDMDEIISSIGVLKPEIETLTPGHGVIYQSLLFTKFGQTTSGKLAGMPAYQSMTIRNHNTLKKLYELMKTTA